MVSSTEIAPNQGVLHRVEEVIRGQLQITEVLQQGEGKGSYLCKRLSDNAELLVECVSSSHTISPMEYIQRKNELLAIRDIEDPWILGSFELPVQDGIRLYVVKIVVEPSRTSRFPACVEDPDEKSRVKRFENKSIPRRQTDSDDSNGVVVSKRDRCHLEINIPSGGLKAVACMLATYAFVCVFGATALLVCLWLTCDISVGVVATWACLCLHMIAVPCCLCTTIERCRHTSLIITPEYFRYNRALELIPMSGASVKSPDAAVPKLITTGNWSIGRVEGETASLKRAKISVSISDEDGSEYRSLVLEDVLGHDHYTNFNFCDYHEKLLVSEINEVLENIRRQAAGV